MSLASIYNEIINDVMEKVKEDFLNCGYEEETLGHLQRLWTQKLHQSGTLSSRSLQADLSEHPMTNILLRIFSFFSIYLTFSSE